MHATIKRMSSEKKGAATERRILQFFWQETCRFKKLLFGSLLLPVGYLAMNTFFPFYVGKMLAALGTDVHHATHYLPFLIGAGLIGALGNRFGAAFLFTMESRVMANLQTIALSSLMRQSTGFHNNRVAGKLVSDAIDFPQAYVLLGGAIFLNIIPLSIALLVGIVLVMTKSWELGLVLAGMVAVTIGVGIVSSNARKPLRARRSVATKAVTAHLADTIVNNQTVKTFAREEHELHNHRRLNKTLLDIRISDWVSGARAGNNRMFGLLIFQIVFAFVVIHLVQRDPQLLAIGIFAFTYSLTLASNLFSFNLVLRQMEDAFLQAEPLMEVIEADPAIQDQPGSRELIVSKGSIDFNNVSFAYTDNDSPDQVFKNLELHVAPGEKIGLVGTSGGGKTTLTRLLLRFDDIQAGSITIDDQDISQATQASLRSAIAYVPQEPLMFHRSVAENIAYGKLDASAAEIEAAARQANAHGFITQLPDGYNTLVGERGVKLSGGQRQRVAIARAILKDAPILLLDEATSALDSESEVLIQQALEKLMQKRTTIVIAHRLSTIQKMDRILVMDGGQVTEQGTHHQLLAQKGIYAKLWAHQSGGFLED